MKKRSFWFVMLVAIIGISLNGCGSSMQAKKGETAPPLEAKMFPPPQAKVVAPETKKEIPVVAAPAPEIKIEVPPPSVPAAAPQKKKKG
jgi:hypothetical protein